MRRSLAVVALGVAVAGTATGCTPGPDGRATAVAPTPAQVRTAADCRAPAVLAALGWAPTAGGAVPGTRGAEATADVAGHVPATPDATPGAVPEGFRPTTVVTCARAGQARDAEGVWTTVRATELEGDLAPLLDALSAGATPPPTQVRPGGEDATSAGSSGGSAREAPPAPVTSSPGPAPAPGAGPAADPSSGPAPGAGSAPASVPDPAAPATSVPDPAAASPAETGAGEDGGSGATSGDPEPSASTSTCAEGDPPPVMWLVDALGRAVWVAVPGDGCVPAPGVAAALAGLEPVQATDWPVQLLAPTPVPDAAAS
ncbi:hypothetical protein [Cellulomonas endophytica]|uniref:hypothetical protein n=1 Tax=Cellulomonas endophytica TaxID=2494735 RepID=UPI0010129183|nr:hypothetical protein [Cellulomonas endophytica]